MHAVRVTVICDECVRIEYAPHGRFCDHPSLFAIHGPAGDSERIPEMGLASRVFTTSANAGSPPIEFRTKRLQFHYHPDGRAPDAANMHAPINHASAPADVQRRDGQVLWTPGAKNLHNLGGTLSTLDGLRAAHPVGDGLLARDGWHLVDDSTRHVLVDNWAQTREQANLSGNTDWYLFAYGDDYPAALRALTIIAGRVPMPRRYALGAWYSRYWPYTADEYRGIVDEFEVHGFPLDVLVLDMDWHKPGWTGWSWNRELFPDPDEFLEWVHSRGLAVTLNLHPADGVAAHEDRYREFMHAMGREPNGETIPFDAGDRRYMEALFEHIHRPLETSGTDFWWLDWQQSKYVRSIPNLSNVRWLNHLYFQHTTHPPSSASSAPSAPPRENSSPRLRGLSFSRWAGDEGGPDAGTEWGHPATGGWGDHRHPIHFSGDAHTGWKMLAFQVPFTVTSGNIGCFFWSHDIGGHFGPRLEETATRWVQFGALSAALRMHSARAPHLDRRPWTYQPRFCDSMRRAFELRAALMPYIYTCVRACHDDTLPLLRPMYLHSPHDQRAYRAQGQYLLGDHLLAAPIVQPGIGERCIATQYVWFPNPKSAWHDLHTGERHESGSESIVAADIDHTPLFLRAGTLLPTRPPTHRMTTQPLDALVLRCFPGVGGDGETCESTLYEDDGLTLDHKRGRQATTPLIARWSHSIRDGRPLVTLEAEIGSTRGQHLNQLPDRTIELHLGAVHRVWEASINGTPLPSVPEGRQSVAVGVSPRKEPPNSSKPQRGDSTSLTSEYLPEEAGGTLRLRAGTHNIRTRTTIRVSFEPADPRLISHRPRLKNLATAIGAEIPTARLRDEIIARCAADPRDNEQTRHHRAQLLAIGAGIGTNLEDHSLRIVDSLGWIDDASISIDIIDRLGHAESIIDSRTLALESRAASLAIPSTELLSPPVGLKAQRLARLRFTIAGAPMLIESELASRLTPMTNFLAVGPFDWDWRSDITKTINEPQSAPVDRHRWFSARNNDRVTWLPAAAGPKWDIDLRASLHTRGGLAYAATIITSPTRQRATLHIECGDKLEGFLGGEKIITLDDHSPHGAPEPLAHITLPQGESTLLIKTSDGGGGWGFSARLEAEHAVTHHEPD